MKLRRTVFVIGLGIALSGCAGDQLTDSVRTAPGGTAGSLKRLGQSTMESGDYASAAGFYRRAHQEDERDFDAVFGLGVALSRLGANDEAAQMFRKALDLRSDDPNARRELGYVLVAMGQASLAIAQFEAAFEKSQDPRNLNGIGVALDTLGDQGAAQAQYRAGIKIDPANVSLRNNLALSLAVSGKYSESLRLLEPIGRSPNATTRQRQNLALVYGLAGDRDKAGEIARLDLDEAAVRRNLVFYETLRAMGDPRKVAEAVGLKARAATGGL